VTFDLDPLLDPALIVLATSYAVRLPVEAFLAILITFALTDWALHLPSRPMTPEERHPWTGE